MPVKPTIQDIIGQFKSLETQLSISERDRLRTEMLSYLLFKDDPASQLGLQTNTKKGLSKEELDLIRKLAEGTDLLHRLKKDTGW